jgi:hypothetical protein
VGGGSSVSSKNDKQGLLAGVGKGGSMTRRAAGSGKWQSLVHPPDPTPVDTPAAQGPSTPSRRTPP